MADSRRNLMLLDWPARYVSYVAILLVCGLLGIVQPAQGQRFGDTRNGSAQVQPPTFRVFALGTIRPVRYDLTSNQPINVGFSSSSYSRPYLLPANGVINFYRMKDRAEGLPPERVEVAQVRVRESERPVDRPLLIVLLPNPDYSAVLAAQNADYSVPEFFSMVLDDSFEAHPLDTIRIVNYAQRDIGVKVADEQLALSASGRRDGLLKYPSGDRAIMQIAAVLQGAWTPVTSTQQMFEPQTRLTLFIADQSSESGSRGAEGIMVRKIAEIYR